MSAAAPWSVKGIDPKAREVAKDLARRSGMTLGEWLNRVILEDDVPEEVSSQAQFPERPAPRPLQSVPAAVPADAVGRIARALDRLTDRIEASETRTGLAISSVEHSVREAVARIDTAERAQGLPRPATPALQAVPAEPPAGPRSRDALRRLDARARDIEPPAEAPDLEQLGRRLAEAEARTADALDSLQTTLAGLDRRLAQVETLPVDLDNRMQALGAELAGQVDAAREAFAERLAELGAGPTEDRLAELARHVEAAEQRSGRAVEVMGREVLLLAQALGRRVESSEQRSATAIGQVSGEVTRIAGMVESRLGQAEQVQADALEKLGAEMGRITDRLTERLLNSERRAAQAIDDVGEQMGRVSERFERRQERASADLAECIRQSEARTAELLAQGRREIDDRLLALGPAAAGLAPLRENPAPTPPAFEPAYQVSSPAVAEATISPAPGSLDAPAVETETSASACESPIDPPPLFAAFAPDLPEFDDAQAFAPIPEPADEPSATLLAPLPEEPSAEIPLSTRQVIDQARAAARAAQGSWTGEAAKPSATTARRGLFGAFRAHRRAQSTLQTALMVAGGAAFLSVGAAGVVLLEGPRHDTSPPVATPRAAVALAPQVSLAQPAALDPGQAELSGRYAGVLSDLQAARPGALAALKSIAEAGYAPAQLFLAKLYEKGEAGVAVNPAEARRWVARAADAGDASAMHQLAVYDFRGEGGPENLRSAATWFRKAAERGVVDSQYNLALLYRSGSGVERNLAEAYRWFSVAAANGDIPSRAAAEALRAQLTPAETAGADKAAAAVLPQAIPSETAALVRGAQRNLGQLGYFKGSPDGVASPGFKVAVAAYQRDHGLAATGMLDPTTSARLSATRP
jgi:localization factor PodJL